MADISWRDMSRVEWGATLKLALGRGVASASVLTLVLMANGYFEQLGQHPLVFFLMWSLGSFLAAPLYTLMLRGLGAVLTAIVPIASVAIFLMQAIVSIMVACGDPIIFILNKSFPRLFGAPEFGFINFKTLIFLLRPEEGPSDEGIAGLEHEREIPVRRERSSPQRLVVPADLKHLVDRAFQSPGDILGIIDDLDPALRSDAHVKFARFIALERLSFANAGEIDFHTIGSLGVEPLRRLVGADGVANAVRALQELATFGQSPRDYWKIMEEIDELFRNNIPGCAYGPTGRLCFVVERFFPGKVHDTLGYTSLHFFGGDRVFFDPTLARSIPEQSFEDAAGLPFTCPRPVRSVVLTRAYVDSDGAHYLEFDLYEDVHKGANGAPSIGRMKLGDNGDVQFEMIGATSQSARPAAAQQSSAAYGYVSEPQRARRGSAVPAIALSMVLAIAAAAAYVYVVRPPGFEALHGQRSEPDGADRFIVEPYYPADPADVLFAREDASNYRLLPFARDDVAVLGETVAGEALTVTGMVRQPDGEWYQVRLRDGRTAYIRASLVAVREFPSTDEDVLAEVSPVSSAPSPVGHWIMYAQWGTDSYVNSDSMEVRADGSFYSRGVRVGPWTRSENRIVLTFQNGAVAEANLSEGALTLSGTMRSNTGQTGTFSARRVTPPTVAPPTVVPPPTLATTRPAVDGHWIGEYCRESGGRCTRLDMTISSSDTRLAGRASEPRPLGAIDLSVNGTIQTDGSLRFTTRFEGGFAQEYTGVFSDGANAITGRWQRGSRSGEFRLQRDASAPPKP